MRFIVAREEFVDEYPFVDEIDFKMRRSAVGRDCIRIRPANR